MLIIGGFCVFAYAGILLAGLSGALGVMSLEVLLDLTKITLGVLGIGGVFIMIGGMMINMKVERPSHGVPSVTKKIIDELKSMQQKITKLEKESFKKIN